MRQTKIKPFDWTRKEEVFAFSENLLLLDDGHAVDYECSSVHSIGFGVLPGFREEGGFRNGKGDERKHVSLCCYH